MAWKAVDSIEEAAKETRELLLPLNIGLWAKLTFLTLLTGSGLNTAFLQTSFAPNTGMHHNAIYSSPTQFSNVLIAVTALILSLGLLFTFLNSIAEFAFFKTLLTKKAKLWNYFTENTVRGLRYMAYRIFVLITAIIISASSIVIFSINPFLGLLALLFFIPLFLALTVLDTLIRDFVLLEMLEKEQKLIDSIKSVYRKFRPQWREVTVYLVVRLVLTTAIAVAIATLAGFTALMFALPAVMLIMLTELSLIFVLPLIVLSFLFLTLIVVLSMPFNVFLYRYKIEMYQTLQN